MTRDPARDGSDFAEETILWRRPQRRPKPHAPERKTIKAHALAHISRSARRSGTILPRGIRTTLRLPSDDPHAEEPTAVASAANHPELARMLAVEIAAAAMLSRSAPADQVGPAAQVGPAEQGAPTEQVGPADPGAPVDPGARADEAATAPPTRRSAALAAALAPPVATPVERARLPMPSIASGRAAIGRSRRSARARVRAPARRRPLPLAALLILVLLWAAAYQQAWSALSMSERCRAVWRR